MMGMTLMVMLSSLGRHLRRTSSSGGNAPQAVVYCVFWPKLCQWRSNKHWQSLDVTSRKASLR